jgi:hypothetical protein
MKSDPTLKRWYKFLNKKFFHNELTNNVCVRWSDEDDEENFEDKYFGIADRACEGPHEYVIIMSRPLNSRSTVRMATLAHEMVHIATDLKDNHGPAFEAWRQTLADRGLFKKGAVRRGITLF